MVRDDSGRLGRLLCHPGMNCIKIGLPGKLILLKIVSENRFSGKTYFYTIAPSSSLCTRVRSGPRSAATGTTSSTLSCPPSAMPSASETSGRQFYHGVTSPPDGEVNLGSPHHPVARFLLYTTFTPWFSDMCQH